MNSHVLHKSTCAVALPDGSPEGTAAPEWVQIMPNGVFRGRDGRGPWRLDDAEAVARVSLTAATAAGIPMDYEHQLERASVNGQPAPASGWIRELQARDNGIWARVDWTDKAAAHIRAREYRYLSPVFYHDAETGTVTAIESVALTNLPNLNMKALARKEPEPSKEPAMSLVKTLASIVKLPEDSSEDAVTAHVREAVLAQDNLKAMLSSFGLALGSNETEPEQLVKAAQSVVRQAAMPDPTKWVPMDMFSSANKELASLKAARSAIEAERLVEDAKRSGKLSPSMEKWGKELASRDPDFFKKMIEALPDLRPGGEHREDPDLKKAAQMATNKVSLSADEKAICRAMGIGLDEYVKANQPCEEE